MPKKNPELSAAIKSKLDLKNFKKNSILGTKLPIVKSLNLWLTPKKIGLLNATI
tara:strand:+ start:242 stop:403 length:162 start_codon:yes stop_codon:yes gene_type:complete